MMDELLGLLLTFVVYGLLLGAGLRAALALRLPREEDRIVFAATVLPVTLVAATVLLGSLGALARGPLLLLLTAVGAGAAAACNSRVAQLRAVPSHDEGEREIAAPVRWAIIACAALALGAALVASGLLETWAWDSLGYHLPIAHDALQVRTLRAIPGHVAYIETYPRFADLVTTAHRVLLGNERFVELSQWPFLPLLAGVAFRIARRLGVARAGAWALAAAPMVLPIVYLQCATSYVDVAYAALLLGGLVYAVDRESAIDDLFASGLLGLALATKPSAPTAIAVGLASLALVRVIQRDGRALLRLGAIGLGAAAIGGKVYVENLLRFGNPVWPVSLRVGSWQLPGYVTQEWILGLGVSPDEQRWSWIRKLATSWFFEARPYVFDMRFGGFGPIFAYVALPIAVAAAWKNARVRSLLFVVGAASLSQSGAFTSRYTIAFATIVLVLAGSILAGPTSRWRVVAQSAFGAVLAFSAWRGHRGFTDAGPTLASLAKVSERERAARVGLDDHGADWYDIREAIRPGEAFGYDLSFGLPSLAFRKDGQSRLVFLGAVAPDGPELEAIADRERIRFLAIDRSRTRTLSARFRTRFASSFDGALIVEVEARSEPALSANP